MSLCLALRDKIDFLIRAETKNSINHLHYYYYKAAPSQP